MNQEQALEILSKMEFFQGQRAGRELWQSKPEAIQNQDISNFCNDIQALREYITATNWTPCAERLPTETDKYWVTFYYYGELFVEERDYFAREKYWGQGGKPIAWMPKFKPDPYRVDQFREPTKMMDHIVDANKKMEVPHETTDL